MRECGIPWEERVLDVVVTAGFDPAHPDPLAAAVGAPQKALIDILGHPMVWWTVQALQRCPIVGHIVVVGVDPTLNLDLGEGVECLSNVPDHLDNVLQGVNALCARRPDIEYGLIVSGDVPLLQPESITWLAETCLRQEADFWYSVVSDVVMEATFPGSRRSFVKMKEGRFCGGDVFVFRPDILRANLNLARRLMAQRKNAFKLAQLFGWVALFKVVIGQLSIPEGERIGSRLLQCRTRVVVSPYADIAMDVDKPHQLEMARRILAERLGV